MPGPTITSNFDTDAESWTIQGDVQTFSWQSSGGDPGGHLAWVDAAAGADSYWDASSAYLGDKSGYYGGSFSYAIEDTGNSYSGAPDLELTGDGMTLVRAVGQPADGAAWTPFTVTLSEAGWHVGSLGGAAATALQMQQVLGNLTQLLIRAEFVNGDESGGLDSVAMAAAPCYRAGTMILTDKGYVAVEHLSIGDMVLTAGGHARPVTWLGHRHVACGRHPRPMDVWPILVAAHAFAEGQPRRDLYLSPDHAVFIDGVLMPIRYLQNGATIRQVPMNSVTYHHVELQRHDVLLAEGLPTESYLDTGNRSAFANSAGAMALHPDFALKIWAVQGCARLVLDGAELVAVRGMLLERAELLGHRLASEAAVHLVVDGRRVRPQTNGRLYRFEVPRSARALRLVSRCAVPAHVLADSDDGRRLGVAVSCILVDGQRIPLDDARLGAGWHAAEGPWRWTDGNAELVLAGAHRIEVQVAMTLRYWIGQMPASRENIA